MNTRILTILCLLLLPTGSATAMRLITSKTIETQKNLTKIYHLKNGIPVIVRTIKNSDILQLKISFKHGRKDQKPGEKINLPWLADTMTMATKQFPKDEMFKITDKYSMNISCVSSVEEMACGLGTINDYWNESITPFASIILEPSLSKEDAGLQKGRLIEKTKQIPEKASTYINRIVNRSFYGKTHSYRLTVEESLKELKTIKVESLRKLHKKLLNANLMNIVVVSSKDPKELIKILESKFGSIPKRPVKYASTKNPKFRKKNRLEFEHRDLPTAYIRAKVNAPSINSKDAVISNLMFEVLGKKMFEEIRSNRSLSYTPYARSIYLSIGIGVMDVSTPKPKEAIEALSFVVNKMKNNLLTTENLNEYKNRYATKYFLTQESHKSLAIALSRSYHFFKGTDYLYELPAKLAKVTPKQIQAMAKKLLVNFRVGVLYDRTKFKDKWIDKLP